MSQIPSNPTNELKAGEPTWSVALLFPSQGNWSEQEYLALDAGRQIEFDNGFLEVLELPTQEHQRLVRFLFLAMQTVVQKQNQGEVFFAPLPIRLWQQKYREPDLVFLKHGRHSSGNYPDGADLAVEVLSDSPADRQRDLQIKRDEYEKALITEYWIVDSSEEKVIVHRLVDGAYVSQEYASGEVAVSEVLEGLAVDIAQLLVARRN